MQEPEHGKPTSVFNKIRKRFPKRLFHWGVVFLIMAWICSMPIYVSLEFQSKGNHPKSLMLGYGSIGIITDHYSTCTLNRVVLNKPEVLWSNPEFRSHGKYLFRSFFGRTIVDFHSGINLVFPIVGFIWIWLLVGWMRHFKKTHGDECDERPRQLARWAISSLLLVFVFISERGSRRDSVYAECVMKIRNIQQAIRGYQGMENQWTDDLIPWNEIIGAKKFLPVNHKKCRRGGNYRLISHFPEMGVLAAECRDPDHQKKFKHMDTSTW